MQAKRGDAVDCFIKLFDVVSIEKHKIMLNFNDAWGAEIPVSLRN